MKVDEQEGQKKKHESSHVQDVCNEVDKTVSFDPPSELPYEANDTIAHDENKSVKWVEEDYFHEPHPSTGQLKVSEDKIMAPMRHFLSNYHLYVEFDRAVEGKRGQDYGTHETF